MTEPRTIELADKRVAELKADTSVIPAGSYCYRHTGEFRDQGGMRLPEWEVCPYWAMDPSRPEQDNGYCAFMKTGDWTSPGLSLLWDQVKECGFNDEPTEEEFAPV